MTQKERHFEFMKAAVIGAMSNKEYYDSAPRAGYLAVSIADAALEAFEKRWPEKENGQQFYPDIGLSKEDGRSVTKLCNNDI